jgi:hypothetical protein
LAFSFSPRRKHFGVAFSQFLNAHDKKLPVRKIQDFFSRVV